MAQTNSLVFLCAMAMSCLPALADDYSSVAQLVKAGDLAQAQVQADKFLATQPKDLRMRFIKGVILQDAGKASDAIAAFIQLRQDYPSLPEPHNNLAVLYASAGEYEMARVSLEAALGTHTSYSIAHENLGDLHGRAASQVYYKALQVGGTGLVAAPKLELIREMVGVAHGPAPAPNKLPTTAAPKPTTAVSAPKVVADSQEVEAAVAQWASAWSARDVKAYLGAYGQDFEPAGRVGRKAWEAERTLRIAGKSSISVRVGKLSVRVTGQHAIAKFRQDYKADELVVSSSKTLELAKTGERWYIVKEVVGN